MPSITRLLFAVMLAYVLALQAVVLPSFSMRATGFAGHGVDALCLSPSSDQSQDKNSGGHGLDCCMACRASSFDSPALLAAAPYHVVPLAGYRVVPAALPRHHAPHPMEHSPLQPRAPPVSV